MVTSVAAEKSMLMDQVCAGCRASREQGMSSRAERSSIDLAAGLARSPQKACQDSEDSCEFDSGLFPSFKTGESFCSSPALPSHHRMGCIDKCKYRSTGKLHID